MAGNGVGHDRRKGSQRLVSYWLSEEERHRILLTCNQAEYASGLTEVISARLTQADANTAEHTVDVMCHGHQACADRSETVAAQQVEGQGPQQGQNLHPIALAVAMGVLTELRVA